MASVSPLWVKITDFGISKRWADTALQTHCGTALYQAPELHRLLPKELRSAGDQYTWAVDMWALGAIVHEVLTSRIPFTEVPPMSAGSTYFESTTTTNSSHDGWLLAQYCNGQPFPVDSLNQYGASATAIAFVKRLMIANPKDRVSAADALLDGWFSETTTTAAPDQVAATPSQKSITELAKASAATPQSRPLSPPRNLTAGHHQTPVHRAVGAVPFSRVATPSGQPLPPQQYPAPAHHPTVVPVPAPSYIAWVSEKLEMPLVRPRNVTPPHDKTALPRTTSAVALSGGAQPSGQPPSSSDHLAAVSRAESLPRLPGPNATLILYVDWAIVTKIKN